MHVIIRPATLHEEKDYSVEQTEGALGVVFGVVFGTGTQRIEHTTYLVAEAGARVVGCGGWRNRKTFFGGNRIPGKDEQAAQSCPRRRPNPPLLRPSCLGPPGHWKQNPPSLRGRDLTGRTSVPRSRLPPHRKLRSFSFQRRLSFADPQGEAVTTPKAVGGYRK